MAHFAQLDNSNTVINVIVINNSEIEKTTEVVNNNGFIDVIITQSEASGVAYCKSLFGADTNWVQTSYNRSFRGKYAGIGDTYNGNVFESPIVIIDNGIDPSANSNVDTNEVF